MTDEFAFVPDDADRNGLGKQFPVFALADDFTVPSAAFSEGGTEHFAQIVTMHSGKQKIACFADNFSGGIAGDQAECTIDRNDVGLAVYDQNAFVAILDDAGMKSLPLDGGEVIRDVGEVCDQPQRVSFIVGKLRERQLGTENLSRFLAPLDLDQRAAVIEEEFVDVIVTRILFGVQKQDVLAYCF